MSALLLYDPDELGCADSWCNIFSNASLQNRREDFSLTQKSLSTFMAVAIASIGIGSLSSASAQNANHDVLQLASAAGDYARFGLKREIEPWEDGRRTSRTPKNFEWWYFDSILSDGTVVVAWMGDNWPYGSHKRTVSLEILRPREKTIAVRDSVDDPGSFSQAAADAELPLSWGESRLDRQGTLCRQIGLTARIDAVYKVRTSHKGGE